KPGSTRRPDGIQSSESSSAVLLTYRVADSSNRVHQLSGARRFKFHSELAGEYVQGVALDVAITTPDRLYQSRPADHPSGVSHQHFQNNELGSRQRNRHAGALYFVSRRIKNQVTDS